MNPVYHVQYEKLGGWETATNARNAISPKMVIATEAAQEAERKWPTIRFRVVDVTTGVVFYQTGVVYAHRNNTTPEVTVTSETKENLMQLSSTLTVPTKTLIEKIEAKIDEARQQWQERKDKAKAALQQEVEWFMTLLAANPEAVVRETGNGWWDEDRDLTVTSVTEILEALKAGATTIEQAVEKVKGWSVTGTSEFKPDPQATKLLSVLTAATNKELEVTADDDLYKYL